MAPANIKMSLRSSVCVHVGYSHGHASLETAASGRSLPQQSLATHCSMLKLAFSLHPVLLFRAVCASSRKIELIRTLGNLFSTRPSSRSVPVGRKDVANHFSDWFLGSFLSHARLLRDGHYSRSTTRITATPWSAVTSVIRWLSMMSGWLGHNVRLSHLSLRYSCTNWTAIAPSPTAEATRLTELDRTSPAANTPGRLVSSRNGCRGAVQ